MAWNSSFSVLLRLIRRFYVSRAVFLAERKSRVRTEYRRQICRMQAHGRQPSQPAGRGEAASRARSISSCSFARARAAARSSSDPEPSSL